MIYPAEELHLKEILDIESMVFSQPWTRNQLKNELKESAKSENWIYMEDQQIVGYLLGWKILNEFHLNNIAVHNNFQKKHIGRSLILHVIERLVSQNIHRIYLEVSADNKSARLLYDSMGFLQDGVRTDYYAKGDHAILYHLDVVKNG